MRECKAFFIPSYAGDASSFNTGQDQGDVAMVAVGAAMIEGGTGAAAGGAVVTVGSGGLAAPVSGTIAVGGVVTAVAGGALVGKAAASLASRNGRVNSAGSEQMSRKEAIDKAKNHSQVPRKSKGGEEIGLNDLNPTSRGKNWQQMKGKGAKKLGQRNPNGKNQWMEHPDGHPDAGQPNVPKHHDSGHVHSTNRKGDTKIFPYNH